jgi:hypothetical protein
LNYTHSKLRDNKIMKTYQATPPSWNVSFS